ncbi:MAG: hypothetical protein JXB49_34300 [Bacteroidales bacterium]|nr:hypothetical protein [Bacteroidales bacterium]
MHKNLIKTCFYFLLIWLFACNSGTDQAEITDSDSLIIDTVIEEPKYLLINPTFLGCEERNYYGNVAPDTLGIIWKLYLGKGETVVSKKDGRKEWAGAGWTGQPLLVMEKDTLYVIQGAFDHKLKKIKAETGEIVWQYEFDDVIKGTGTIWYNKSTDDSLNSLVILQGSRFGLNNSFHKKVIPSYRAISYFTGEELWRLNVWETRSYSRDVDASALIINDTAYIGLENAYFIVFNPDKEKASLKEEILQPEVFQKHILYKSSDVIRHGGNLVTEASPSLLANKIYIASGSGHIWGYNLKTDSIDWDFYIGSDIDGSPVVTYDKCLLVSVEKQYIKGKGGIYKLDPSKTPDSAVVWFFPTGDKKYASWEGGVIGTACVNDKYIADSARHLAAFTAMDGNLYVVIHDSLAEGKKVLSHDNKKYYPTPKMVYKKYIMPSISTPIMVGNKLVAPGYGGLHLFSFNDSLEFTFHGKIQGSFEATPVVHDGRMYVASRGGYLYCLGRKSEN